MRVVRYVVNLVLAVVLVGAMCLCLAAGLAIVWARGWERYDLTEGSAQHNWVWIDERPIHYWIDGPEGSPAVALIHGHQVEGLETWRGTARALTRSGLRVVAIDLLGFGHSARDPLADLSTPGQAQVAGKVLNELRLSGATVVGHGWGAAVALEMARMQPQLVGRLVLVDPIVAGSPGPAWRAVADVPYLGRAAAWAFEAGGPLWAASLRRGFHEPSRLSEEYLEAAREASRIHGTLRTLAVMAAEREESDLVGALGGISQPVLILRGADDPWVTHRDVQRLARELPDARTATIPEAGHYPQLERGSDVSGLLLDFSLGRAIATD